ncbi:MAG: DNA polymerase I [Ignavibacteriales bacterium]|nr:MAG: DNA polymerase I [Ignavibacteriales bacterium]
MSGKKFVIIDAMALAYKAYFAFKTRPLYTKNGEPTSAVFGFLNQIIKIYEDLKPDYAAVAFDSKEKTFRHEMYAEYKGTRDEMPDDMIPQIGRIKEVVEALGIPLLILPGYEADDIIGAASSKAEQSGLFTYMISPDKDYVQLVTDRVYLVKPGRSGEDYTILSPEKVLETYEFSPNQMIDYLSLLGDQSDNIPGAKGIGEKGALKLIKEFGTIDSIYERINEVTPEGTKKKLLAAAEDVRISKDLITIRKDIPLDLNLSEMAVKKPDYPVVRKLFTELEFSRSLNRIIEIFKLTDTDLEGPHETTLFDNSTISTQSKNYTLIRSVKEMKTLAEKLSKQELFVFDTETDSLDRFRMNMVGAAFSFNAHEAYYIPFRYAQSDASWPEECTTDAFAEIFKPVFENASVKKICQNGKFDISVLKNYGITVNGFYFDTMVASYILDPDQKHNMDDLSRKYLDYDPIPLSSLIGEKKDPSRIYSVPVKNISDYSCEDADVTYQLFTILNKKVQETGQDKLAHEIEFPLVEVLADMERAGIRVDVHALKQQSKELQKLIESETTVIHEMAGQIFNVGSPAQLQKILFENLKLPPTKKIKSGYSTDAQSLESIRNEHEIVEHILNYRTVSKLKSTYTDSLPEMIHPLTGRIHSSFNQVVAATGRLSSVDPNLQNIPIRTELGKDIRKAFIPADNDHILLSADYSQIELRIMAHLSGDEYLVNAFKNGEDIHRSTAALVFGISKDEVTSDMRRKAKEVNFGILYGIGVFGLKTRLGISQQQAKEIIDGYFTTFKSVKSFMDESINKARERGFSETITGRRRYLKNINSSNFTVRQFEERVAINMPIQGAAADIIKLAMVRLHHYFREQKFKSRMVLQVHDELVFDVYKPELEKVKSAVIDIMQNALPLSVPMLVEAGTGVNWLDAH